MYRIDKSFIEKFYNNLDNLIENNVFKDRYVVVFGTSSSVAMLMSYLEHKKIIVNAIVDNSKKKQGGTYYNVKIYSPESILKPFRDDALILIVSTLYYKEMTEQLEEFGYNEKHIFQLIDFNALNSENLDDIKGYFQLNDTQIKKALLDVLIGFRDICSQNNLKYWIGFGTLLGAVRHKGFIPWDDDVDVLMPLNDYNKLSKIIENNDNYSIISSENTKDYSYEFPRFVKNGDEIIVKINTFFHKSTSGVFIDVFPLRGLPDSENEQKQYIEELKTALSRQWGSLYSETELLKNKKAVLELMSRYNPYTSRKVSSFSSIYFERVPKEIYEETTYIDFENEIFAVPEKYDELLRIIYKDYMKLPPEKSRKNTHSMKVYKKITPEQ